MGRLGPALVTTSWPTRLMPPVFATAGIDRASQPRRAARTQPLSLRNCLATNR
jgi:hypothetical protein